MANPGFADTKAAAKRIMRDDRDIPRVFALASGDLTEDEVADWFRTRLAR